MPWENESVFIAEGQSLDVDEQKKKDISGAIESCNSLQDFIEKLEKEKLIWYFIGPLLQDKDIKGQVSQKWETDFQEFEQSINRTQDEIRNKFEKVLSGQSFLAYSTKDNNFNIRFQDEKKPIKISDILRASNEDEVYNLFLGEDSQIIACKKNSNERYYDFAGPGSCEMTINWQAKDSRGNDISCSIAVVVGSGGIQKIIGEPRFGDLKFTDPFPEETKNEILKLVEQNKEVFINGKNLYQTFTDMSKSVDDQQEKEISTKYPPVLSQSPASDSSGYSSPSTSSSRKSSSFIKSKVGDEEFEITDEYIDDDYDKQEMHKDDERKYEQEGIKKDIDEIIDGIEESKEEKEILADCVARQVKQLEDLKLERDKLQRQLKEKEEMLINTQKELKSVKERLEELQNVLKPGESQTVVASTQTEVGYESRGIQASIQQRHVETETTMPETRDRDTQAVDKSSNEIVSGLRQENKNLTRDKQTISEQLKQKVRETEELKERLKKSQEENEQLKQKVTKGAGVDASSSTDQKETKEMEVQTDVQMNDFLDLHDKEGKYVRTELSDPNLIPNDPEKSRG